MSEVGSDLTSSFVIKELTGDQRELTLRTRALPYRPFELSGSQRNSVDWYPGSPIGTLQVYGAKEEQTTINGQWKDVFLGGWSSADAPAIVQQSGPVKLTGFVEKLVAGSGETIGVSSTSLQTTRALVKLVDDMRRKGQEVEVTWLDQIRRGIIERFTVKWHTGHDCEWEILFTWISQGETLDDSKLLSNSNDLGDLPNRLQSKIDAMDAAFLSASPSSSTLDQILGLSNDLGNNIQEFTDNLTDSIIQAGTIVDGPADSARRVAGILDGIKLEGEDMYALLSNEADGALLNLGSQGTIGTQDSTAPSFGVTLAARGTIRDKADAAASIRDLAAQEQSLLIASITSTNVIVFQARDGQDLRSISQQVYGTPDEWRALMLYNQMVTSELVAGQVIFVPAVSPGDAC